MAARSSNFRVTVAVVCAVCGLGLRAGGAPQDPLGLSGKIKAGLPLYEPTLKTEKGPNKPGPLMAGNSAEIASPTGVVRMSPYVMHETKPLTDQMVMTGKATAAFAMDTYLGGLDGIDRGFINAFTLPELWQKIPLLGLLPFAGPNGTLTNEERAMRRYRQDETAEMMREMKDFDALGKFEAKTPSR